MDTPEIEIQSVADRCALCSVKGQPIKSGRAYNDCQKAQKDYFSFCRLRTQLLSFGGTFKKRSNAYLLSLLQRQHMTLKRLYLGTISCNNPNANSIYTCYTSSS
jgi:hypothetical protein